MKNSLAQRLATRVGVRGVLHAFLAAALLATGAAGTAAAETVRVGITSSISDATFFIADKKGYFKQEGLSVTLIAFDAAAKMIAPLGTGQLDVGAGASNPGLYNAVARGVNIKIVADKGSTPPGYGYQPLLVRKDLIDSGRVRSLRDLKGLKFASVVPNADPTLVEALRQAGLKYTDVEVVGMGFPHHVAALQNKAVDASFTTEPSATRAIQSGAAVRFMGDDVVYPNHQLAVLLFGGDFIKNSPDAARKFMRAYIKAVRDYNDALKDGRLAGANAQEIISILTEYTNVKDAGLYKLLTPHGSNPDGRVNEATLKKDFAFFKERGLIEGNTGVDQVIDNSFVDAVVKELGPYRSGGAPK